MTTEHRDMGYRLLCVTIILLGIPSVLFGQEAPRPSLQLARVHLTQWVSVQLTVFSPQRDLIVPYCGETEGGTRALCNLPTHLEVETKNGWRPVKLRHMDAVLGGVSVVYWKIQRISAGGRHDFSFGFPQNEYAVEHGQLLRVLVDAWPDEESMKTGERSIQLASASFECP
jgi:hypothetical protein